MTTGGYDPFDIGLFFSGWVNMHIASQILDKNAGMETQAQAAKGYEKIAWNLYLQLREKVDLTDDQVIEATGFPADKIHAMIAQANESFGN